MFPECLHAWEWLSALYLQSDSTEWIIKCCLSSPCFQVLLLRLICEHNLPWEYRWIAPRVLVTLSSFGSELSEGAGSCSWTLFPSFLCWGVSIWIHQVHTMRGEKSYVSMNAPKYSSERLSLYQLQISGILWFNSLVLFSLYIVIYSNFPTLTCFSVDYIQFLYFFLQWCLLLVAPIFFSLAYQFDLSYNFIILTLSSLGDSFPITFILNRWMNGPTSHSM